MKIIFKHLDQESIAAVLLSLFALGLLLDSWLGFVSIRIQRITPRDTVIALLLAMAVVVTYKFPIHLRAHTKIYMNSVPLYLIVVMLPLPFAILAIGLGTLIGQWWVRKERGSLATDIAISTSRWMIVGFLAVLVTLALTTNPMVGNVGLFATAFVLFVGDLLTASLHISLYGAESFWRILVNNLHEGAIVEGIQYLLGILGVIAAAQEIWTLALLALPIVFAYLAFKSTKEMRDTTRRMLESMADAVDLRDPYTGGHSNRVADFWKGALKELGIVGVEADLIRTAARLHDIGKIGIPDEVLKKPGSLSPQDWELMKSHPERGAELLARYPDFSRGAELVRCHHERWDGKGYPRGLKGEEIPLGARVIAVADAFDAMTSERPYRRAMSVERAAWELKTGRGKQWDPAAVDGFLRAVAKQLQRPELVGEILSATFAPVSE